jgi:type III restriction enzyme
VFDDSINKLYVMANESYEDFARALQTEYEDECGVTFGKVPIASLAKITRVVEGVEQPIGMGAAKTIFDALVAEKMIDTDGRIQAAFQPSQPDFTLTLPDDVRPVTAAVIDVLASYQMERHVARARDQRANALKKEVVASPEFLALWERIKPRTTYRVEFETDELVRHAVRAVKHMPMVERPKVLVTAGLMKVGKAGVGAQAVSAADEVVTARSHGLPDMLAYLQNETELTRSTLVRILVESGRLAEVFNDPQRFMDSVASLLKHELRALLVDGIKYERLPAGSPGGEWEMLLFENEEVVNYLSAQQVTKSVYEYVTYDSEIERAFAKRLDEREDIKLFVKLPRKFEVDTPLGKYIPDWAIVKHDKQAIYLVRETKSTHDFLKLRTDEANKVRCGQKHFEAIGVPFAVVVNADEV